MQKKTYKFTLTGKAEDNQMRYLLLFLFVRAVLIKHIICFEYVFQDSDISETVERAAGKAIERTLPAFLAGYMACAAGSSLEGYAFGQTPANASAAWENDEDAAQGLRIHLKRGCHILVKCGNLLFFTICTFCRLSSHLPA